jgi:ribonuclease-3
MFDEIESKRLSKKIHYTFKNKEFLETSLTHRSVGNNNNERLEFLGDSILNFVIASALYQKFPEAKEGELSRLRASLVNRDTLAELAREIQLGDYLILGQGELKTGGCARSSILSDAMEAVIGAIYLDSDMKTCEELILSWYVSFLDQLTVSTAQKDPKTELQEYLQSLHQALPRYELVSMVGDDDQQLFIIHCYISLVSEPVKGEGNSRKKAEQDAAKNILKVLLDAK